MGLDETLQQYYGFIDKIGQEHERAKQGNGRVRISFGDDIPSYVIEGIWTREGFLPWPPLLEIALRFTKVFVPDYVNLGVFPADRPNYWLLANHMKNGRLLRYVETHLSDSLDRVGLEGLSRREPRFIIEEIPTQPGGN